MSHAYLNLGDPAVAMMDSGLSDTGHRLDRYLVGGSPACALINKVFDKATQAVATGTRLRAVGIEYTHPAVGVIRWHQQQQTVGPYAKMAVANDRCQL
jgi:hypothetical protein